MRFKKIAIKVLGFTLPFLLTNCIKTDLNLTVDGVSIELAKLRNQQLSNIKYNLNFMIPDSVHEKITGFESIEFDFNNIENNPLILDFRNPKSFVKSVKVNKKDAKYLFTNEHIIIPNSIVKNGKNTVEIEFIAGNRALNRNNEYMYTLFVPDRACTAFPCFDQPSLKARFRPKISVPNDWIAIGNSNLIETNKNETFTEYIFDESMPISTYLFAFVAGRFKSVTKSFDDRQMTMYHREKDQEKLNQNIEKLFELHYSSLLWLEEYTRIKYPFKKFDFVIIPSFQYSGMEHPGAILYRDSKLFLEESSTLRDELSRANLIAHETAHMWFGDLVTMEWFSEVWLKEVFANFMAGKIVNPQYPHVNHDLSFLINHYPAAYSVDRSKGANPIEQELTNMKNAGTLYGSIIYHKAPIVMKQLEEITGEKLLQKGVQQYLGENQFGNASWNVLINILDGKINDNLEEWSRSWVFEPGMPHYKTQKAFGVDDNLQSIIIEQYDPWEKGRQWPQKINVLTMNKNENNNFQVFTKDTFNVIDVGNANLNNPHIFTNSNGMGYGYFKIDSTSKNYILKSLQNITDPVIKCSMYISLWENMLNQNISPYELLLAYTKSLKGDNDPQNINLVLGYIESIYWKFLTKQQRNSPELDLEEFLWNTMQYASSTGVKSSFFKTYLKIATSKEAIEKLFNIWKGTLKIKNLKLSENDLTKIAFELSIRNHLNADSILNQQLNQIEDNEKKERFAFIRPAVSNDINTQNLFFEKLKLEKNREKEPWVIDAIRYLHHPLKSEKTVVYIRPSLEMLEELQITGDIFFPKRWLDVTFSGHSSIDAVTEINLFLNENPNLSENLQNKILQSADLVYRASIIKEE